ncbi:hypothetical protein B0H17DRAFT_1124754 [Mycena rosella]|uniref:DNA replication regulator Sld3 C-terminal domain-containing protein n=1 Tax=Mycena rosella TaxID=1033263 RepID=A0AAD7H049_MYCRO|nr:hypothetical protein B0H17DRAFT_1124754 [Mycena rosella]
MAVKPLQYALPDVPRVPWTATQEKTILHEYPLNLKDESSEDFTARTYFQFLWLPDSIMPLRLLIPSLLRVTTLPDSVAQPHPLHALLERLLLTSRAVTNKYHVELPYILANGGGEGEEEESVMWFAVTHEKSENDAEEPWLNDAWRSKWMERMERREVQVQILLYMLKLSLPGPPPPPEIPSPSKKRRKLEDPRSPSLEDRLEAFMDKLSMWQLVSTLNEGLLHRKGDRDWMQTFFEEVVEPRFGTPLAAQTALFRSKIFPHSPFSDFSDSEDERATSPDLQTDRARSVSVAVSERGASASAAPRKTLAEPARSRSRSLSVSLAQERELEQQREGSAGAKRRVLNREVSMKRAFKPRERDPQAVEAERREKERAEEKQRAEDARGAAAREEERRRQGVMLVAATPVKSKVRPRANAGRGRGGEEERGSSPDLLLLGS